MARDGSNFSGPEVAPPPALDGAPSRALAPISAYPLAPPEFGMAPPRGPEILTGGFNQTWLANCLRRRWLMAILMGLLIGCGVAGLLMFLFPEIHQITAYLRVNSKTGSEWSASQDRLTPQEIERQAMNHLALLKSQMVLEAALAKREINSLDAVQAHKGEELLWLMSDLRVSFPGDGEILEVRYDGEEDYDQMKKIVDAVVQAYKDKVLYQDRIMSAATRSDLEAVARSTQERLQNKREELKEMMAAKDVIDPDVEVPRLRGEITRLENLISEENQNLVNVEIFKQLAVMNARDPAAVEQAIAESLDKDPIIVGYQNDIFELTRAIQQRRSATRNPNDSTVKRLESQLEQTQMMMNQHRAAAEKSAREQIAKMPNSALRAAIVEHRIRFESSTANLEKYNKELAAATEALKKLGVRDPELEMLEQDI
ncbi:MAG TPA: hypothetical protein VF175_16855, partial [Lacipirellula sp.]